jgi:hypothetical protein
MIDQALLWLKDAWEWQAQLSWSQALLIILCFLWLIGWVYYASRGENDV